MRGRTYPGQLGLGLGSLSSLGVSLGVWIRKGGLSWGEVARNPRDAHRGARSPWSCGNFSVGQGWAGGILVPAPSQEGLRA